jgi:hypothetical protein
MSALPPKADINRGEQHVRFVPIADMRPPVDYPIISAVPKLGAGSPRCDLLEN